MLNYFKDKDDTSSFTCVIPAMYSSRRICTNFAISNTVDNAEAPEPDTMYDEEDEDSQLPSDRQLHGFNYTVDVRQFSFG